MTSSKAPKQSAMPFLGDSGASDEVSEPVLSNNSLFQRCADKWGVESQVYQGAEECIELALALHHILRISKYKTLEKVIEEMADVELMIDQLKYLLEIPNSALAAVRKKKIYKLRRLLKKEVKHGD